jgi:hypothetical protein
MDDRPSNQGVALDKVAIALSGLCLAHCLLLPGAVVLLPLLGQFNAGHFHVQMLLVVVPVSLIAFGLGFRRHRNPGIVAWGLAGLGAMLFGGTIAHAHYGVLADTVLTVAGSIVLACAHYFNNRLTRHFRAMARSRA